jgi:hypothetical protein
MNHLAAKAEMAVRTCKWGSGLGGIIPENREFIAITTNIYDRLSDLAKLQARDRTQLVQDMLKMKKAK